MTVHPTPEGLAVYFRNIDRRKALEMTARTNEERFQLLARATNDVIWDWDLVNDELWWNDAVEDFCGYYAPGGQILYVGDADAKWAVFEERALAELGVTAFNISSGRSVSICLIFFIR